MKDDGFEAMWDQVLEMIPGLMKHGRVVFKPKELKETMRTVYRRAQDDLLSQGPPSLFDEIFGPHPGSR